MQLLICSECGDQFDAKRKDAKFCSSTCRKKASRGSPDEIDQLISKARRLSDLQVTARGLAPGPVIDGKRTQVRGPFIRTQENEDRARQIIALRRRAAHLAHPI